MVLPTDRKEVLVNDGDTVVSYTQFSMYNVCPHHWELAYARKLRSREPNIYLLFGSAMHNTIQEWLEIKMTDDDKVVDLEKSLIAHMHSEFQKMIDKWGEPFSSPEEIEDFIDDGVAILKYLEKNFGKYFSPRKYEFIGCELPVILIPDHTKPTVKMTCYLDLVFREKATGFYVIKDIKTSTRGWNTYQKRDMTKIAQLVLYKKYFSKLYDIDMDKIRVDYFIVKRKINPQSVWDKERIQEFVPIQSRSVVAAVIKDFEAFVDTSFDNDGAPRLDIEYPAISGIKNKNCKFCEFADKEELCPKKQRLSTKV